MKNSAKNILDLTGSLLGLIFLSPVMIAIAFLIYINMGGPVIFKQKRPGYKGEIFTMYKFRTMKDAKDDKGELLADHIRLTKLGRFLRSTSLDELPELFNVLKRDMSLVGPRPLIIEYLERYSPEQMRRHEVKPGITGWAQVNGRNSLSWTARFKLDVWYVDHHNLWLDLKIIFMTFSKVMKREDIAVEGKSSGESFMGNTERLKGG